MDDCELLREYRERRSEPAFAALVERHVGLVYAVARRVVREPAAAEDVAQAVFIQLARKAGTVRQGQALSGWLYRATQRAAFDALRGDHRRRQRETIAMNLAEKSSRPEIVPEQLAPLLEQAMGQLGRVEQDAVVLRYFEGKTLRETGEILALSEDAARKRVDRALDKMRAYFARGGITASAALLATALTAHAAEPPPAGLAAGLAHASLAQAAQTGLTGTFLKGLSMTTKTKMTLVTAAMVVLAAIPITLESRQLTQIEDGNAEMARQNSILQLEMNRLRTQLQSAQGGSLTGPASVGGPGYIPLSIEILKGLNFIVTDNSNQGRLSDSGAGLFGLTPDEASQVSDVLTNMKDRVETFERTNLTEIALDQVTDPGTLDFLKKHPGAQSVYEIPPMSEDDRAALQKWFMDSISNVIGPTLAEILASKAMDKPTSGYFINEYALMHPGAYEIIDFSDHLGADGKTPLTDWHVTVFNDSARDNTMAGEDNYKIPFPSQWNFLFNEVRDGQVVVKSPPKPLDSIQSNLRQVFSAAQQYMLDKSLTQAAYADFVGVGTDKYLRAVTPVSGENYGNIVVHQTDSSLSVDVPGRGVVEYTQPEP